MGLAKFYIQLSAGTNSTDDKLSCQPQQLMGYQFINPDHLKAHLCPNLVLAMHSTTNLLQRRANPYSNT